MLVHQMAADADFHGLHQHLLLVFRFDQFRHVGHNCVRGTTAIDIFLREIAEQLDPIGGTILIFHGHNQLILIAALRQDFVHFLRQQFPALRVVSIVFVRMVMKQFFIFFFGVTDKPVVILIGPHAGIVLIDEMLADADV